MWVLFKPLLRILQDSFEFLFFANLFITATVYFSLNIIAFFSLRGRARKKNSNFPENTTHQNLPAISVLMPAYNEANVIVDSVRSALTLDYPNFEVVVINDGSTDQTLSLLIKAFQLTKMESNAFESSSSGTLPTSRIIGVYVSTKFPWLRLIDKKNGGKADALNAGINFSVHPLYCCVDADGVLEQSCLRSLARPFVADPGRTVAVGGTVRIANGCTIEQGCLKRIALPGTWLVSMQVVEYLRAFLLGRMGWSSLNALLIISGALGLFKRSVVVELGGYTQHLLGEDMELVTRMHRVLRERKTPYKIVYVPEPVCWTEAPQTVSQLRRQRVRWQRGMCESLRANKSLFLSKNGGLVGSLGFGFSALFEGFGPLLELSGILFFLVKALTHTASFTLLIFYLGLSIGMGLVVTCSALLIEEINFKTYPRLRDLAWLGLFAVAENFIFRQLVSLWRLQGTLAWIFSRRKSWGEQTRMGFSKS